MAADAEDAQRLPRPPWPLIGVLVFGLLVGWPSLTYPFGRDQGMFAYVADVWLNGGLPYRDAWDIKPPGVFMLYAAAQTFFGRDMAAIRVLDLLSTLLTAGLIYRLVASERGTRPAMVAAAAFPCLYYFTFGFWDTAQAESFAGPLCAGMVAAALHARRTGNPWSAVAAGLALGAMVVLKTTFLVLAPLALAIVLVKRSKRLPVIPWALLGTLIVPVGVALWFRSRGVLQELADLLGAQLAYARPRVQNLPLPESDLRFLDYVEVNSLLFLAALFCVVGLAFRDLRTSRLSLISLMWLATAFGLLVLQRRFFSYHGVPLVPPLAILVGLTTDRILSWSRELSPPGRLSTTSAVVLIWGLPFVFMGRYFGPAGALGLGQIDRDRYLRFFVGNYFFSAHESEQTAALVKNQTNKGDPILVMGFEPTVYFAAERYSPTRHVSTAPILGEEQIPLALRMRWLAELKRDCTARPPKAIVVLYEPARELMDVPAPANAPEVRFVGQAYRHVGRVRKFSVYVRRDPEPRARLEN